ncbi:hypothetical protein L6164_002579 [Bauhinia variegata]|uniref:Uncharacterized protein n=1 Tax=Bauhinia variegata TaxID=167791 RepID=A0ACB9PYH8_BAUVA|nr:hypothetical protein L6164_002579 [Bauhinia variegata]
MALELALQFSLILWPLLLFSPTVAQQTRCDPKMCGNISIPFPFGMNSEYTSSINSSCIYNSLSYLSEWFEIDCRANQTPFLKSLNLEVTKIDIESNTITLMHPIYNCKNATDVFITLHSTVNLVGSPFLYSQKNIFITFGCNTFALLWSNSTGNTGCYSSCESEGDLSAKNDCSGKYCCQTTPPFYLSNFNISIRRVTWGIKSKTFNPGKLCDLTFIVDQTWLEDELWKTNTVKNVLDQLKSLGFVPSVLDWRIPDSSNLSFPENQSNLSCSRVDVNNATLNVDIAPSGWSCRCRPGFRGNPYVSGGCIGVFSSLGSISLLIAVWTESNFFKAKSLASHFVTCLEENYLFDTLDDRVLNKEGDKEHIMVVANLAKRCLNMTGKERPTMREVTMELEGLQNLGKGRNKHEDPNEIKTVKTDPNVPWDVECFISVDSISTGMASSSSEVLPLMYK